MREAHLFSDGTAPIAVKHHKIYHENHKEIRNQSDRRGITLYSGLYNEKKYFLKRSIFVLTVFTV